MAKRYSFNQDSGRLEEVSQTSELSEIEMEQRAMIQRMLIERRSMIRYNLQHTTDKDKIDDLLDELLDVDNQLNDFNKLKS